MFESGADVLVKRLCETVVVYGIPEELTSDRGPQFTTGRTRVLKGASPQLRTHMLIIGITRINFIDPERKASPALILFCRHIRAVFFHTDRCTYMYSHET